MWEVGSGRNCNADQIRPYRKAVYLTSHISPQPSRSLGPIDCHSRTTINTPITRLGQRFMRVVLYSKDRRKGNALPLRGESRRHSQVVRRVGKRDVVSARTQLLGEPQRLGAMNVHAGERAKCRAILPDDLDARLADVDEIR